MDEILKCDHSNESYLAVLSNGTVYYAVQGGSDYLSLWMKSSSVTIQMKATEQYFPVVVFVLQYFVDEICQFCPVTNSPPLGMRSRKRYKPINFCHIRDFFSHNFKNTKQSSPDNPSIGQF